MIILCFSISVAGEDFEELKHAFRFESGEVNQCFDIQILDDKILETTENFTVHLNLADGASKDILLGESYTDVEVSINDMDGILIIYLSCIIVTCVWIVSSP